MDTISSTVHSLIASTMKSFTSSNLNFDEAIHFIKDISGSLPSSSIGVAPSLVSLNECILDAIWSIDADIEDREYYLSQHTTRLQDKDDLQRNLSTDRELLVQLINQLLFSNILDRSLAFERLDLGLLVALGALEDKKPTEKKEVRARTALFYKQNKFNLLREQMEGYTKLVSEVSGCLGPPHDSATGLSIEGDTSLNERAKVAWRKVLGLIGYFDLDPNRALDVLLDMFISHVSTHYTFFLSLLRQSPWCRKAVRRQDVAQTESIPFNGRKTVDVIDEKTHITPDPDKEPPSGGFIFEDILRSVEEFTVREEGESPICAQIMGFKFSHYLVKYSAQLMNVRM